MRVHEASHSSPNVLAASIPMGSKRLRHENKSVETFHRMQAASVHVARSEVLQELDLDLEAAACRQQAEHAHPISKELPASTYQKAAQRATHIFFHRRGSDEERSLWVEDFFMRVADEQKRQAEAMDYPELGIVERLLLAHIEQSRMRERNARGHQV